MKKILLPLLLLCSLSSIAGDINIPDANFKSFFVGNASINTNGDSEIQLIEAISFTGTINCSSLSISDLTGIENFVALTGLNCGFNSLTELDLSTNTNITSLYCNYNSIGILNLTNNTVIDFLVCNSNALTELHFANGNNAIINYFNASANPNLSCIEVDNASYSTSNWVNIDATTSFSVNCNFPPYVNPNAAIVYVPDVNFKTFLLNNGTLNSNGDSEIQVTEAFAYTGTLNCSSLSINDLTGIEYFLNLTQLNCGFNGLSSLDLITNSDLTSLYCNYNALQVLNLSNNSALTWIVCNSNDLIVLNVANGNNSNVNAFYAQDNVNLSCIQVDNASYSTINWTNIDVTSSFSTNCNFPTFVNSITVQGQGGTSTINVPNGTLQMEGVVLPVNATDLTFIWSVANGTGSANIDINGILAAQTNGTITVTATSNDNFGVSGSTVITISNQTTLVNSISVQGQGGVSTITTLNGTLQMEATVLPVNASDLTYTWSVSNGIGTIDANGLLTAQSDGDVTVTATANDGSGTTGSVIVTITNQIVGIEDLNTSLSIFPNPTTGIISIKVIETVKLVEIYNITGEKIINTIQVNNIDLSHLSDGVYFVKITFDTDQTVIQKLIKE